MCGISGIAGLRDPEILREGIEKMTRRLAHRGPDAEGFFVEKDIALGHRRLSVIDLSEDANQPIYDASGRYVLIFNGEMYNYLEVKAKLPDYPFRTGSDTEVLLAAYNRWGDKCLSHFNGMFAFAIWDKELQELFVARDRLGVKPFYYFLQNGVFVFASELRALLASGLVPARTSPPAMANYLMYQSVPAPETILEDVRQLMPGECGVFRNGNFTRRYFWKIGNGGAKTDMDDAAAARRNVRRLLTESVERRMVSDVPLGAFLSGGIDSSAVVGLMAECSEQAVNTFSITFGEPEFDESYYSNLIAKRFNTRHTPILLRPEDFLESLPAALEAMDNPSGDGFNTYLISKVTKEAGITVALSGIGGDELFAGYESFKRWLRMRQHWLWRLPKRLRAIAGQALSSGNSTRLERFSELLNAPAAGIEYIYPAFRQTMTLSRAKTLLHGREDCRDMVRLLLSERKNDLRRLPFLSQYTAAEMSGYTFNVLLKDTDQMSMASALEVREPFFDYRLVEYVLGIPDPVKYPHYPKSLLVESLSPLLPEEIVHRPKKGFTLPWKHWLQNELKDWCAQNVNKLAERPEFNGDEVRKTARRFFDRPGRQVWMPVFQMAVLEDWLERNI